MVGRCLHHQSEMKQPFPGACPVMPIPVLGTPVHTCTGTLTECRWCSAQGITASRILMNGDEGEGSTPVDDDWTSAKSTFRATIMTETDTCEKIQQEVFTTGEKQIPVHIHQERWICKERPNNLIARFSVIQ